MEPVTAFAIATLMMLLNGGVLGLVHRDLPEALQPSAMTWRIGTLLMAGGCVLLAVQDSLPPGFVLPLANGMLMLGLTAYWHALRQFYGERDSRWLLLPPLLGTLGIYWYSQHVPDIGMRVLIAMVVWAIVMLGAVWTLHAQAQRDAAISRRVLAAIFLVSLGFVALRSVWFFTLGASTTSVIQSGLMNLITPMIAAILPVIGTTAFLLLCSERIRRQWEHAASTDNLTGLANRRVLADSGQRALLAARERGTSMSVAVVDVDHFKRINDSLGHDAGDMALRQVADCLQSRCRGGDLAARHGGEEFVVLLADTDAVTAIAQAERLRSAVEQHRFVLGGEATTVTVSIGVATRRDDDLQFDQLLRRADLALYAAKAGGRNRVQGAA